VNRHGVGREHMLHHWINVIFNKHKINYPECSIMHDLTRGLTEDLEKAEADLHQAEERHALEVKDLKERIETLEEELKCQKK